MTTLQIQHLLNYLGYDTGGCDGLYGPKTKQAVTDFQKDIECQETGGTAGEKTEQALKEAVYYGFSRPSTIVPDNTGTENTGTWWDDIQYFTRQEFACRCREYNAVPFCDGFPVEPSEKLVRLADRVRGHFGRPAIRTSGIRCPQHNQNEGGVENSKHKYGKALDFFIDGVRGQELLSFVQAQPETSYAYLVGGDVIHMDVD